MCRLTMLTIRNKNVAMAGPDLFKYRQTAMSGDPSTSLGANEAGARKTCFVIMGFGKKVDFETGKTFDLDMTYQNLIKPAVEAANVECIRADEITHAGVIDV